MISIDIALGVKGSWKWRMVSANIILEVGGLNVANCINRYSPRSGRALEVENGISKHTPRSGGAQEVENSISKHTPRSAGALNVENGINIPLVVQGPWMWRMISACWSSTLASVGWSCQQMT